MSQFDDENHYLNMPLFSASKTVNELKSTYIERNETKESPLNTKLQHQATTEEKK